MEHHQLSKNLPSDELDLLIFKRRRFRAAKACYPCRRRKVKCNLGQPCGTCNDRGHPDLCDYAGHSTGTETSATESKSSSQERPKSLGKVPGFDSSEGLYVTPILPNTAKVHLGSASLPGLLSAYKRFTSGQSQATRADHPATASEPQALFELLCLQDSSTMMPFTNLWGPADGLDSVCAALPEDEVVLGHIRYCRASLFRILPSIIDFTSFEGTLSQFLIERKGRSLDELGNLPCKCTPSWLALLFGILSCGAQLASSDEEVDMTEVRVFACCSFQCLRLANFISFPNVEVIQALIMLVNFLQNQADAGASWSMLGLTIRLAQTLGLHCVPDTDQITDSSNKADAFIKTHMWRALIWQDTLISLCYDRPTCITVFEDIPEDVSSAIDERQSYSFADSCHRLFTVANHISQAMIRGKFSKQRLTLDTIDHFKTILNRIGKQSAYYLQDVSKCQNRDDCIEHYFFRVFRDSVILCLCHPAVLTSEGVENNELHELYLHRCRSVLNTYLELLRLDCPLRRSWVFVHVTLSCALSLGLAAQAHNDQSDQVFLQQFLDTLSATKICANVPSYDGALLHLQQLVST